MNPLTRLSQKLRPDLAPMESLERAGNLLNMYQLFLGVVPALGALTWLIVATDSGTLWQQWPLLLLLAVLTALFGQLNFRLLLEARPGVFVSTGGSLEVLLVFSAALIFGPTGLWVLAAGGGVEFAYKLTRRPNLALRWSAATELVNIFLTELPAALAALWVYGRLGGTHPFPGLRSDALLPALAAIAVALVVPWLLYSPLLYYITRMPELNSEESMTTGRQMLIFSFVGSGLSAVAYPFTLLAAELYVRNGQVQYLFLVAGALLASLLAHRLSQSVQRNQQRSRELANLEQLNRQIIEAPPDASTLPQLLAEHTPRMFGLRPTSIWRADGTQLYAYQTDMLPNLTTVITTVQGDQNDYEYQPDLFTDQKGLVDMLAVPIKAEDGSNLGGIYILFARRHGLTFLPALQSLAAAVAAALHRAEVHAQLVASERMTRELEVAGEIQATFLPDTIPQFNGWEIAATLVPARQTSGDFYDFIPLADGRLGIVVADVADKGTGAALYMALSRTLIRTYALQYPDEPERALQTANERIRQDTDSDQFVTVFYGVLDVDSGSLTYANAGHNPAFLLTGTDLAHKLIRTGIPLGMFAGMAWERAKMTLAPGDLLLIYTDGVTEAQDSSEALFGEERLLAAGWSHQGETAEQVQQAIVTAIRSFVGGAAQFDDITLMVVSRPVSA